MTKTRLDQLLLEKGLAVSREKAAALIMAGEVFIDGRLAQKSGMSVNREASIEIRRNYPYVSRGAFKIERVIREFNIKIKGKKILDVGISTGGFTDFLLQNGAALVTGVDVNIKQVDSGLRCDKRLHLVEKNARYLRRNDIEYEPDLIVMDLSFISVIKVLPALAVFKHSKILVLVKPQFEAEKGRVGKGGVIKNKERRQAILLSLKRQIEELDFSLIGLVPAGIKGRKGNQEYFFLLEYGKKSSIDDKIILDAEEEI